MQLEAPESADSAARQGAAELTLHEETLEVNDPDLFLRRLLGTDAATPGTATNVAFLRSPLVDGMLVRASQLGFRPERFRLYQRLQSLLAEELPYVPLYVRLQWMVARPGVRGIQLDPGGIHHLERISLEPPPATAPAAPVPEVAPPQSSPSPLSGSPPPAGSPPASP